MAGETRSAAYRASRRRASATMTLLHLAHGKTVAVCVPDAQAGADHVRLVRSIARAVFGLPDADLDLLLGGLRLIDISQEPPEPEDPPRPMVIDDYEPSEEP